VETGLKAGDKVIVDGLSKLHPSALIKLGGGAPPAAEAPAAPAGAPAKDGDKSDPAPKT